MTFFWLVAWLVAGLFQRDLPDVTINGPHGLSVWTVALVICIVIDNSGD